MVVWAPCVTLALAVLAAQGWGLQVGRHQHQRQQQQQQQQQQLRPGAGAQQGVRRSSSALWASAAATLIRKSKTKENDKLREQVQANPEHVVNRFLRDGSRPLGILDPVDFYKTCFKQHDSVTIMPEYNKKTKTGFIAGMPPPEIMGGVLRDAGAKAIVASLVSNIFFFFFLVPPMTLFFPLL